jgi:hypothetical protein
MQGAKPIADGAVGFGIQHAARRATSVGSESLEARTLIPIRIPICKEVPAWKCDDSDTGWNLATEVL